MPDTFEEKYIDVLHNIELALARTYREHDDLTDFDAREAVNALIRVYQAQLQNRAAPALQLSPLAQKAFENAQVMCEFHLGRGTLLDKNQKPANISVYVKTVDEIVACLKRIRRSIEMWNKELGRRGYFDFVKDYVR
ncbi:MAG: hypothetical protein HY741_02940 [Chloroflexi bacterium]|nr:hypothetical protein [Chloroflexota bacterium]